MGELRVRSVLVTGANRGIGLGLVQHFLAMPSPPKWVFAGCREPKGQRAQEETLETMRQLYTTNTIGPMLLGQAFLPLLKKAAQESPGAGMSCSRAAIINMSSAGGSIGNTLGWDLMQVVSYRCSKAALNMLTKCQSLSYQEHGILCVALHPGWVQTDMGSAAGHQPPVTVDASVRGMLKVLSSLSEKDTGTFLDWEGKVVPW
ncbi:C-signal-like isoform X1 [Pogoniulus pusillus]|uniref:C-signal-like isoform X1 n=1 Tax=Pogoniulus pusillus TaxID=488313 RepID=UPI0030B9797D